MTISEVLFVEPYFYLNRTYLGKTRACLVITYKKTSTTTGKIYYWYTKDSTQEDKQFGSSSSGILQFTKPASELSEDMELIKSMQERSLFGSKLQIRYDESSLGMSTLIGKFDFQLQLKKPTKGKKTTKGKSTKKTKQPKLKIPPKYRP